MALQKNPLFLFSPLYERGAERCVVNGLERSDERELAFWNVPQALSSDCETYCAPHSAAQIEGD